MDVAGYDGKIKLRLSHRTPGNLIEAECLLWVISGPIRYVGARVRFRKHSRPQEPTLFLLRPNVLANLRQVSGGERAIARQ